LCGCATEPARSFERQAGGTTQYLDDWSETRKEAARSEVSRALRQVMPSKVAPGDTLEVVFQFGQTTVAEYKIAPGDSIRVEFLRDPDNNIAAVKVRPDGKVTLPRLGSMAAAGVTVEELGRQIGSAYRRLLKEDPGTTVNLVEFETPTERFAKSIRRSPEGFSRDLVVARDGSITLPSLAPVSVSGRSIAELKSTFDAAFAEKGLDVTVSLIPKSFRLDRIMIFGEVSKPGAFDADRPLTILTAVAGAGGVTNQGSLEKVMVFYVGDDSTLRLRSVNLMHVLADMRIEEDMLLPNNSVIYVPPTDLALAGRKLDAIVRDVLRFTGFTFGIQVQQSR
jgi:protein involved in polysaccharide export with SLBB domain